MNVQTEADIDGSVAKQLREQAGLTQAAFWNSVGLTQAGGCRYERGNKIPRPIRILLFTIYVAGIRLDPRTQQGAEDIRRLARLQASEAAAHAEKIGEKMAQAMSAVRQVNKLMQSI
jgi:transcriptional regulator with XRE-family HTH domain